MNQLTIIGGAGINIGVHGVCPFADEMLSFTYDKLSASVYKIIEPEIRELFKPESFDFILGGLLAVNLALEKAKENLRRYKVDEGIFSQLFRQSDLQLSIVNALERIEDQLTISQHQLVDVVKVFDPVIENLSKKFDVINYFTTNFDGIFDHVFYGLHYSRGKRVTDFWKSDGSINRDANQQIRIHHLHGDIRYKPSKKTKYNNPPYRWPVLVVGDVEAKRQLIGGQESLLLYREKFQNVMESRGSVQRNVLAIIGFGFRDEDAHIVKNIRSGLSGCVFDEVYIYDPVDHLAGIRGKRIWVRPESKDIISFLDSL